MKTRTRIYTCNAFKGFYPVGSAAVIEAADAATPPPPHDHHPNRAGQLLKIEEPK